MPDKLNNSMAKKLSQCIPKRSVTKQSKFEKSGTEAKPTQMKKKTIRHKYWLYQEVSDDHNEAPLGELLASLRLASTIDNTVVLYYL